MKSRTGTPTIHLRIHTKKTSGPSKVAAVPCSCVWCRSGARRRATRRGAFGRPTLTAAALRCTVVPTEVCDRAKQQTSAGALKPHAGTRGNDDFVTANLVETSRRNAPAPGRQFPYAGAAMNDNGAPGNRLASDAGRDLNMMRTGGIGLHAVRGLTAPGTHLGSGVWRSMSSGR